MSEIIKKIKDKLNKLGKEFDKKIEQKAKSAPCCSSNNKKGKSGCCSQ